MRSSSGFRFMGSSLRWRDVSKRTVRRDRERLALGPCECQSYASGPRVSNRGPRVLTAGAEQAAHGRQRQTEHVADAAVDPLDQGGADPLQAVGAGLVGGLAGRDVPGA